MVQRSDSDGRAGFALRINEAIAAAGWPSWGSAARLAREVSPRVSERAAGKWLSGESIPDTKRLDGICAVLGGISPDWLLTGRGGRSLEIRTPQAGYAIGTDVPIIELATLADISGGQDAAPADTAISWTICPVKHGSLTFAFKMPDNSMACATDQSIPAGHYVWVDPDQKTVGNDTAVLARLESGQFLVGQYMEQAGRRWLRFLNNQAYPNLPESTPFEVVGRVIFSGRER